MGANTVLTKPLSRDFKQLCAHNRKEHRAVASRYSAELRFTFSLNQPIILTFHTSHAYRYYELKLLYTGIIVRNIASSTNFQDLN